MVVSHRSQGKDHIVVLLDELRADPSEAGVRKIVDYINGCCFEYYNIRKAVERLFERPLTDVEKTLVAKLP